MCGCGGRNRGKGGKVGGVGQRVAEQLISLSQAVDEMQPVVKLPAHLIVLFDSLANVDFMSLTKRSLKDKVEVLKNAVAAELSKHSHSSQQSEPQDSRPPARTRTPDPPKPQPKPVRNGDRPPDRARDPDRGPGTRLQLAAKNSGLKSASAVPPPPKFSDLIRLASDRPQDEHSGDDSPPPARNKSAGRRLSPDPRRRHPESRTPDTRSELRARPADDHRSGSGRLAPDSRSDRRPDVSSSTPQSRGRANGVENESRSRQSAGRPVSAVRVPATASSTSRNRQRQSDNRSDGERYESDRRTEEKKPSAKVRKKNEEERLLEIRKQRIRDEEARVKLRNDVLAGKKNSADLKTLVTKSQGSTVLSCGRPPPDSTGRRPPDRSIQRGALDRYDQRRPAATPDRHSHDRFRPNPNDRRPSDRYYDDYDDEDEEDSFIDDDDNNFIDNGEVPDVSQHIREIFGYDKRKYADFDDDDIEESSYAQVQKEEMRSAKIGRKEDLEDMRMELMKKKEKRRHFDRD